MKVKSVAYYCDECGVKITAHRHVLRLTGPNLLTIRAIDPCVDCAQAWLNDHLPTEDEDETRETGEHE